MADKAGGVCTAWQRNGYTIDGALNWIEGTMPGTRFYNFWLELGAAPTWNIYHYERNMINRRPKNGKAFTFYCDRPTVSSGTCWSWPRKTNDGD